MKRLFCLRTGVLIALFLVLWPPIAYAILTLLSGFSPIECQRTSCGDPSDQLRLFLGFGVIIFGPISMLAGAQLLLVLGVGQAIRLRRQRDASHRNRSLRIIISATCGAILLGLVYVPKGPDPCSHRLTDTEYEICLEAIFKGMTIKETGDWLTAHGYQITRLIDTNYPGPARDQRHAGPDYKPGTHFQAFRNHGKFKSVPYGTNFNRIFARIGSAPDRFELNIYADRTSDRIIAVDAWWAFSFL